MKWNTWHGLFTRMIDTQPLSKAEKMTHLQTLTKGKANEAIAEFSCNHNLYQSAMKEFKQRFGCPDVSTAATINALRRFFAHRGTPVLLVSDNAINFVAADNELQLIFKSSPLQNFLANKEVKLKFIPPHAPHFSGIRKRFIRSCKDALYSVIGSQTLADDTFATALNEIEAFLNNRPITDVPSGIDDTAALTPNHFCTGEYTSMCHLDILKTNESLTAEDGGTHNKLQIMLGSA